MTECWVNTMDEMERLYYTKAGVRYLQDIGDWSAYFTKADGSITTSTAGVYNPIYGAYAWAQLNLEANAFGVLPKVPWGNSGWRVITGRASEVVIGGVAEGGSIPDSKVPTFAMITAKPKTIAHVFTNSEIQEFLATANHDDAIATMEMLRTYFAKEHAEHINRMLLSDVGTALAGNNMESIDRVVSSNSELTRCGIPAGYSDIYGQDRDGGASWADAQVLDNSGSPRDLTDDLIRQLLRMCMHYGANPTMWLTGYDTYAKIQGLFTPEVRYSVIGDSKVKVGVNGIETFEGNEVGLHVSTLYGIPMIISKNVKQDTISRLYLLDTSNPEGFPMPRLCIRVAKPTQYFEAGTNTQTELLLGSFINKGMYRTIAELICTRFNVQGKLRDLQ